MNINGDKIGLVTIYQGIGSRSMPYNEIVKYRQAHGLTKLQYVVTPDDKADGKADEPDLRYFKCRYNYRQMRRRLLEIERAYWEAGMPYVIQCHDIGGAIAAHLSAASPRQRRRILFTVHTNFREKDLRYKVLCMVALLMSRHACAVSKSSYEAIPKWLRAMKRRRFSYITNGVDLETVGKYATEFEKKEKDLIVYVARFQEMKNHAFLIEVIKEIENAKLLLIGSGPLMETIKELVDKHQMGNRVIFTGLLPREEVYRRASAAVLSVSVSSYEGMPVGVLEALACGTQGILSDIPSHREIKSAVEGVELLPLERKLWIRTIQKYLGDNTLLSASIQKNACLLSSAFSLERMHEEYTSLYNEIISE